MVRVSNDFLMGFLNTFSDILFSQREGARGICRWNIKDKGRCKLGDSSLIKKTEWKLIETMPFWEPSMPKVIDNEEICHTEHSQKSNQSRNANNFVQLDIIFHLTKILPEKFHLLYGFRRIDLIFINTSDLKKKKDGVASRVSGMKNNLNDKKSDYDVHCTTSIKYSSNCHRLHFRICLN